MGSARKGLDAERRRMRGAAQERQRRERLARWRGRLPHEKCRAAGCGWRAEDDGEALGWWFYPVSAIFTEPNLETESVGDSLRLTKKRTSYKYVTLTSSLSAIDEY